MHLHKLITAFRLCGHQMFGPYAAQSLAAAVEAPLSECLGHLDSQLLSLQDVLQPVMLALQVRLTDIIQR